MMATETSQKAGIWTAHVDAKSGRTYYFNMVHNRSYWELPDELKEQVRTPLIETLREWDPEQAARYEQEQQQRTMTEADEQRRRREELLAAAAAAEGQQHDGAMNAPSLAALQERMAIAAQKKKAEEVQRMSSAQSSKANGDRGDTDNSEYLRMVRELKAKDRDTEGTGSKWLVR
ncbi:hypothetical protein PINS_up004247 [Pythium insidiosum]|nr:hypothetical protein PINS_up004247 [Pythium insidiosum]